MITYNKILVWVLKLYMRCFIWTFWENKWRSTFQWVNEIETSHSGLLQAKAINPIDYSRQSNILNSISSNWYARKWVILAVVTDHRPLKVIFKPTLKLSSRNVFYCPFSIMLPTWFASILRNQLWSNFYILKCATWVIKDIILYLLTKLM